MKLRLRCSCERNSPTLATPIRRNIRVIADGKLLTGGVGDHPAGYLSKIWQRLALLSPEGRSEVSEQLSSAP
jgi:hypothetical protein